VLRGQTVDQPLSLREQVDLDEPLVGASGTPLDQPQPLTAVDQSNDAVVMRLQSLRKFAPCCPVAPREAHHVQKQLVPQRRHALPLAQKLARAMEVAQSVAEV
jgi:hypothetical protein